MALAGWIVVVVALAICGLAWRAALVWRPVVVGERGILDRRRGIGWIHWEEIEGVWRSRAGNRLTLRLRVNPRLARLLRLPSAGSKLPESVEIGVDLAGTGVTEVDLIERFVAHGGPGPPDPTGAAG